jgi:hypothetical protein
MASDRPGFSHRFGVQFLRAARPMEVRPLIGRFHGRQRAGLPRFSWNVRRGECRTLAWLTRGAAKDNPNAGAEHASAIRACKFSDASARKVDWSG